MKRQIIALVAGAALIAAPLMTNIATADMPGGGRGGDRMEKWQQKLNLTAAQKAQLKTIHENAKARMQNVFTAEQKAQLEAGKAAHEQQRAVFKANGGQCPEGQRREGQGPKGERKGRGGMFAKLNLTDAQKAQLKQ
ncbi:MAG: hypothetical protein HC805_08295, partial [Alkalinema sp. RL_2_19]|nr:hypothetical protein [Alkalinema sp. RL_2_19]